MSSESESDIEEKINFQEEDKINFNKEDSTFYKIFRNFSDESDDDSSLCDLNLTKAKRSKQKVLIKETQKYTQNVTLPNSKIFYKNPKIPSNINDESSFMHPRISKNFTKDLNSTNFYNLLSTYRDILNLNNKNSIKNREIYSAFVLNHVLIGNKIIYENNLKLKKYKEARINAMKIDKLEENALAEKILEVKVDFNEPNIVKKLKNNQNNQNKPKKRKNTALGLDINEKYSNSNIKLKFPELPDYPTMNQLKDQGITRPKILIIVPFKQTALEIVTNFQNYLKTEKNFHIHNKKRFQDDYEDENSAVYADGNVNDNFIIGLEFRKKSLKLYANLYKSDIIICSCLALRILFSSKNEKIENSKIGKNVEYDYDFLSSIQITIIDDLHHIYMQNIDNVIHILKHLNLKPLNQQQININRIHKFQNNFETFKKYSQLIVLSKISNPVITAVFNKFSSSIQGQILIKKSNNLGIISNFRDVLKQVVFIFRKIPILNESDSDSKFIHFKNTTLKEIKSLKENGVLIFIPNYFDFIRVESFMQKRYEIDPFDSFSVLTEYCSLAKQKINIKLFANGENKCVLMTERFYYYNKKLLPKNTVKKLVLYSLPNFEKYIYEIGKEISNSLNPIIQSCFTEKELDQLSSILGKNNAIDMIKDKKKSIWSVETGR